MLYWEHGELWCIDLNSSNGTTLNGAPLVCDRVVFGDRLDVGEFGLVFQRLSSGRSQRIAPAAVPSERSQVESAPPAPSSLPSSSPAPTSTQPNPEQPAREAHERQLHEQLAAEVTQLGRERQEMQARWDLAAQQMQAQIAQLHDEAARLAAERQALAQSRDQWQGERTELSRQLAERSAELARLKTEFTSTTAALTQKLAESGELATERRMLEQSRLDWQADRSAWKEQLSARAEQFARLEAELSAASASLAQKVAEAQRTPEPPAEASAPVDPSLLAQLAPATVVTLPTPLSAAAVANVIVPEVAWTFLPAEAVPEVSPPPDPQVEIQARLQETNERLSAQVEQLRAEAAELAAQRQALARSRDDWQAERQVVSQQFTERQQELARQQAELSQATSSLAAKLTSVEQRISQPPPLAVAATSWEADPPHRAAAREGGPPGPADWRAEPMVAEPDVVPSRTSTFKDAPPPPTRIAPPVAKDEPGESSAIVLQEGGFFGDRDELTVFVSDRLVTREGELSSQRWFWWSVGGAGAIVLIAILVTVLIWVL